MSKGTRNIKVNMNCGCLNVKAIDKGDRLNFDMFSHELQCVLMRNGMFCVVRGPIASLSQLAS